MLSGSLAVFKAMVIVVRIVDDNWHLQQQVVRLMLLATSLKEKWPGY